jgi:hypothetical protein
MPTNCAPPRKVEAIACGCSALVLAGSKGRPAPQVGTRSRKCHALLQRDASPYAGENRGAKAIGTGNGPISIASQPTRLDFAPMELVRDLPMGTVRSWVSRRDKSRDDGIGRHEFRSCYDLLFLDGPPLQSKQPAPRWMS